MTKNSYDLKSVQLPRLAGSALNIFVNLLESGAGRSLLIPGLLKDAGIEQFRTTEVHGTPTFFALHVPRKHNFALKIPWAAVRHTITNPK